MTPDNAILAWLLRQRWWPTLKKWTVSVVAITGMGLSSASLYSHPLMVILGFAMVFGSAALWFLVPPIPDRDPQR